MSWNIFWCYTVLNKQRLSWHFFRTGVSNLWPEWWRWPKTAINAAQHKILNVLLDYFGHFFVKMRLHLVNTREIWQCLFYKFYLPKEKYPTLYNHALFRSSVFGNTYICKQLFLRMKYAKGQNQNQNIWRVPLEFIENCYYIEPTRYWYVCLSKTILH